MFRKLWAALAGRKQKPQDNKSDRASRASSITLVDAPPAPAPIPKWLRKRKPPRTISRKPIRALTDMEIQEEVSFIKAWVRYEDARRRQMAGMTFVFKHQRQEREHRAYEGIQAMRREAMVVRRNMAEAEWERRRELGLELSGMGGFH